MPRVSPGRDGHRLTASTTPSMNDARSKESWRIVSPWPAAPKQHLLVGHQTGQPDRVHPDAAGSGAPRAPSTTTVVVASGGNAVPSRPGPGRGHPLGRAERRARRGVPLGLVVEFDDLGGVEPRSGQRREPHHQDGADGEVGGHDAVRPRGRSCPVAVGVGPGRQLVEVGLGESGGPDHDVDTGGRTEGERGPGRLQMGEVHDDLDTRGGQRLEPLGDDHRIPGGWGGAEQPADGTARAPGSTAATSSSPGRPDTAAHLPTHPTTGADDSDSHAGHPSQGAAPATRPVVGHAGPTDPAAPRQRPAVRLSRVRAPTRRSPRRRTPRPPTGCGGGDQRPGGVVDVLQGECLHAGRTSSTDRTSPWSSMPAPIRLIRAPESSQARRVSARRLPLAMASPGSVIRRRPAAASSSVTMSRTSATCSGAGTRPTLRNPAST